MSKPLKLRRKVTELGRSTIIVGKRIITQRWRGANPIRGVGLDNGTSTLSDRENGLKAVRIPIL